MTDDRTEIAAMAMEGILIGAYVDRPRSQPPPEKVAAQAILYADTLLQALAILKTQI